MKIVNQAQFKEKLLELFRSELSKYFRSINEISANVSKSNIEILTISVRRKKICEYMINNIDYNVKNAISKIESNDILNAIVHDNDLNNIYIDIFNEPNIESSVCELISKNIVLLNQRNEHIAYINIEDFLEDNIFTNTQLPLNLFLIKFDINELKITFLHNKINNTDSVSESNNQIKYLKHFQKHFKFTNLMLRAHISSINRIEKLKKCHLINIKKYGNLFSTNKNILNSIISLFSDFQDREIKHIIRNYRNLIKIENKLNLGNKFNFRLMSTIRSLDINRCVIYDDKINKTKLVAYINLMNFEDVLNGNIFLMNAISNKQEQTNFKLKDFLNQPDNVVDNISLIHY